MIAKTPEIKITPRYGLNIKNKKTQSPAVNRAKNDNCIVFLDITQKQKDFYFFDLPLYFTTIKIPRIKIVDIKTMFSIEERVSVYFS